MSTRYDVLDHVARTKLYSGPDREEAERIFAPFRDSPLHAFVILPQGDFTVPGIQDRRPWAEAAKRQQA